ncbi:MAG: 23S rRNA (adenine(2503)-C(2))-methyltransferase RlmN [Phycisphaerales bacterium]|nr:23S rRNA (adenine(2503)-C(2))-methyltransferase RlmN [Phycisphaerales bacterium]
MKHPAHHIFEQTPDSLRQWCVERGWPAFRAKQVLEWVYAKGVADPASMTNLGKAERERLAAEMTFLSGPTVRHQRATDGVQKLLIQWDEATAEAGPAVPLPIAGVPAPAEDPSRQTECVMIPAENDEGAERRTACISSQVGCPVGCRFCASGLGGLDGNLSAGRIVEQVWRLARLLDQRGADGKITSLGRISNVVFMGMGEPLSNFAAVTRAVRILASPDGMGIGARKITISTVGLPKAIEKLAEELDIPVTLALSLHAPNDDLRRRLIPWANYTTIPELLAACQKWFDKTGREITLEYILLGGVNDRPEHAAELAGVARTLRANVNLIRYNEVKGLPFDRPKTDDVRGFQQVLRERGVNTHIRASRGRDIAAACGQLRHEAASPGAAN